jgi:hypothetical protein
MSKQIGNMYHPVNKAPTPIYEGFNWPCLFFGFLWFCTKGLWLWAIVHIVLDFITAGISWLVFPFVANKMHRKHLESKGYLFDQGATSAQASPSPLGVMQQQQAQAVPATPPTSVAATPPPPQPAPAPQAPQPPVQSAAGLPSASTFVFAKIETDATLASALFPLWTDKGWKNEYVIIDASTGDVVIGCQEGEIGAGQKLLRKGTGAVASKFNVSFINPNAQILFQARGGGFGGGGLEVFTPQGALVGTLKKAGMTIFKYDGYDANGTKLFTRKAKGMGTLASTFNFDANGTIVGSINDCSNKSAVQKFMGNAFNKIAGLNLDYVYSMTITGQVSETSKTLMLASFYQLAHQAGVL